MWEEIEKLLTVIGMVFLLLAVGLSGCVGEGIVVGTSKI